MTDKRVKLARMPNEHRKKRVKDKTGLKRKSEALLNTSQYLVIKVSSTPHRNLLGTISFVLG